MNTNKHKFWNIGTDICGIIEKFRFKMYECNLNIGDEVLISNYSTTDKYFLSSNKSNITPSNKEYVSRSAIRQYIDVLVALNILKEVKSKFYIIKVNYKNEEILDDFFNQPFLLLKEIK
ncbi:hypothetical protein [Spiroplasma taiwanense]|uniref:Uncharacterized protein n=1 Tax=Spiroplasma taiwanense CT-1 TaxID=1276220 RepID=S5LXQ3_9MOLU|nr:hypothetical protein [Spiroplasma taiwanense]AGR41381.1 hypothetical protein STAIW_v1c07850 [Spiroplasma taiwanense CT-1]